MFLKFIFFIVVSDDLGGCRLTVAPKLGDMSSVFFERPKHFETLSHVCLN